MIMSMRSGCQTSQRPPRHIAPTLADFPAQRVWLLRRPDQGSCWRFAGGVLVLADDAVYVVVVVSHDAARASEQALKANLIRCQLERDTPKCHTLGKALARSEEVKRVLIDRGWLEHPEEGV
jgi:hypothetical protein